MKQETIINFGIMWPKLRVRPLNLPVPYCRDFPRVSEGCLMEPLWAVDEKKISLDSEYLIGKNYIHWSRG